MHPVIFVDHATDSRLARFANLRSDVDRPFDCDSFIVEGRWCLQRMIDSDHTILSILVERGREEQVASWLTRPAPIYSLPAEQIRQLVGFNFHRGMLACGLRPTLLPPHDLQLRPNLPRLALAAIGINQDENLGSMMRTAAALGIENLLIGPKTADPYSRRTIRVSMATVLKQNLFDLGDPVSQLQQLRDQNGWRIIATTLDKAATPLDEFELDDRPTILIVGNEADGLDRTLQSLATDRVTIPMQLGTDSLNVAVAAAIFLYQLASQKRSRA